MPKWRYRMSDRYRCDACGWDGEEPVFKEILGSGCGGVLWTMPYCPKCGEVVYQTAILKGGGEATA